MSKYVSLHTEVGVIDGIETESYIGFRSNDPRYSLFMQKNSDNIWIVIRTKNKKTQHEEILLNNDDLIKLIEYLNKVLRIRTGVLLTDYL